MNAADVIADIKRRLLALNEDPPFRFQRTSRLAAEGYMRRLSTFAGCTAAEIAASEAQLGVHFSEVFRAYLRQMGKSRGELLCGSDVASPTQFAEFRQFAQDLMHETSPSLTLPADAIVFVTHQGYQFCFVQGTSGFDCPVMNYLECEAAAQQLADSFAIFLDAEVRLMEEGHRRAHEMGGHYVTVDRNGGVTIEYPALSSGDRATSRPFTMGDP